MKKIYVLAFLSATLGFTSCDNDDDDNQKTYEVPTSYAFSRENTSTVDYSGQVTRMDMHSQLKSLVASSAKTTVALDALNKMFNHQGGAADFTDGVVFTAAQLNASTKNIAGATAYSKVYKEEIKVQFNNWFTDLAANSKTMKAGANGQIGILQRKADGSKPILVSANGLEYTQIISKGLMGAMQLDQIVNKYLSDAKLDVENNVNKEGKTYTSMEHHWDEAFGYTNFAPTALSSNNLDSFDAKYDRFWGEYIFSVNGTVAGEGLKDRLMTAFLTGRAAIAAKDYDVRDASAIIIKKELSKACALKAVNYLVKGKPSVLATNENDRANAFHAISEAYGFILGLQFSNDGTDTAYFTKAEINNMLADLDGLYAADIETKIQTIADKIAAKFGFTAQNAVTKL